jgi:hypothetical protein
MSCCANPMQKGGGGGGSEFGGGHENVCNRRPPPPRRKVQVGRPSCGRGRQESKRMNELVKDRESVPCELGDERLHTHARDYG